jgi:serine/threonine-protein kinase
MELVPGRTLADLRRERGPFSPAEAVALSARIAEALAEAHRQGIIHCDVKPRNVVVRHDGQPVLIDFGIARLSNADSPPGGEEVAGSAAYMAPEQLQGEPLDQRADVFGLGALLYELLTGRPPYAGGSITEQLQERRESEPLSPRRLNPSIPPALEAVILTALSSDPNRRYEDAVSFEAALEQALPAADDRTTRVAPVVARSARTASRLGGRRGVAIAALAALLALGLSLALASTRQAGEARQSAPTPTATQPVPTPPPTAETPAQQAAPPPAPPAAPPPAPPPREAPAIQQAPRPAPAGNDRGEEDDDRGPKPKGKAKGQRGRD